MQKFWSKSVFFNLVWGEKRAHLLSFQKICSLKKKNQANQLYSFFFIDNLLFPPKQTQ